MAFAADFSYSQGVNSQNFTLTDTSTGSDPALTGRTVSLFLTGNSLLGGATIDWPLSAGSTLLIAGLLLRDYSLNALVTWESSSPIPGSTYSKARIATFTGNSNDFAEGKLQDIAANQGITNDNGFETNLAIVNSDIRNAERATTYGDQGNAQAALDRIYNKIIYQNLYF